MVIETNQDAQDLLDGLGQSKQTPVTKIEYAVIRTEAKLKKYFHNLFQPITGAVKGWKEWDKGRITLLERHCKKDEKGDPVMVPSPEGQVYDFTPENKIIAREEMTKLDLKHKDYNDEVKRREKESVRLLKEPFTGNQEIYKFDPKFLPSNLTGDQLTWLQFLMKGTEKEIDEIIENLN
ncbi:hypothetical protein LCGC14_0246270 [marine sediment metagenome]|uniref:Uncharacterized protein n=1 Tax=marine sediment metagenome TaxID=412755 RepID=A0A0F9WR64_9ZZZZ